MDKEEETGIVESPKEKDITNTMDEIDKTASIIKIIVSDPSVGPKEIEEKLKSDGIVLTEEEITKIAKDYTFGDTSYGKDYDIISESHAKAKYQMIINNMAKIYDTLYKLLQIVVAEYQEGERSIDDVMKIVSEMRQREKLMREIAKDAQLQPTAPINAAAENMQIFIGDVTKQVEEEAKKHDEKEESN